MSVSTKTKVVRFGKASGPLLLQKSSFFELNDELRTNVERICEFYSKQPLRTLCKNCAGKLEGVSFIKLSVRYIICGTCGHLNGANEDTDEFCRFVYTDNSGNNYAKTYSAADKEVYFSRVTAIYAPKSDFLCEVLREAGEQPQKLTFADMGAGSGYFVAALVGAGLQNVIGYEVSESQLRLARTMVDGAQFRHHSLAGVQQLALSVEASVVSMIGVLEHLQDPRAMLAALQQNSNVNYVFISVPLFSMTAYLEAVFPKVFHRQLSAGHTHLFTETSLHWICREFGFEPIGEWWFGTDAVDLLRHVQVSLAANPETAELVGAWRELFVPIADALQFQMDQRRVSSEVHMVLKKR